MTCLPSTSLIASLPIRSIRETMAVKVHAHAGPVQPRRHLLDMGGLAGAVIALDHHPAVIGKARRIAKVVSGSNLIGAVDIGHAVGRSAKP